MKIEIIIGSGIGIFAESNGSPSPQTITPSPQKLTLPDARWKTIVPRPQPAPWFPKSHPKPKL